MVESIVGVIEQSLILLNKLVPDQATKIANKIKDFREKWDHEISKGPNRDDALLDSIELELRDIRELYASAIASATLAVKP